MATIYCSSCGTKIEYGVTKPKFCSSCGEEIAQAFGSLKKKEAPKKTAEEPEDQEEFSGEVVRPQLGKDIVVGGIQGDSIKFEDLIKQKPIGVTPQRRTVDPTKSLQQQMFELSKPTKLEGLTEQVEE